MKKIALSIVLVFCFSASFSQWLWDYGVAAGVSNYLGDIGGKEKTRRDFVSDMKLAKTRWNVGAFIRYKWRPNTSLKLAFDYLRIEGDDKLSSNLGRNYRNLNFRNDIFDLALTGEIFFYTNNDLGNTYRYRNGFRAYVFGGVGGFYSNPKAKYNGQYVALQPLETEGVHYGKFGVNIPIGIGFFFTIEKKHRIGFELNWRTTFTDYLDDISTSYPNTPPGNALTAALSNRSPELGSAPLADPNNAAAYAYFVDAKGNPLYQPDYLGKPRKRGDPTHKDSYITMNLSYSYVLRGKSSFYRGRYGGFFGKHGKRRVRKIRAKF